MSSTPINPTAEIDPEETISGEIVLDTRIETEPRLQPAGEKTTLGNALFLGTTQILMILWSVVVIFPFVWMITTSFKRDMEILTDPFGLPKALQWDNFSRAWTSAHIGTYVGNTLIVLSMSLTGTLLISAMAAYVLSRFEFPGNRALFLLFTAGLMFPMFLGLVPLYFLMDDLHLRNTYVGLALVYIAYSLPFTIFFLMGFFKTLPSEVAEASVVDGAGHFQTFFQIMLPMAKPGLIAMGIFNFLGQWNQFLLPLVLMQSESRYVLSQGLNFMAIQQGYDNDYSALFAAMTITMVPTLVVYILFQRRLESGLTAGALKG
ncbi:MAG TPA: carbohydrate ABC transporter permease [Thermomicrobiales bacterium]|nr:carbohydrate ABC transporter permease [Thermomicrobiales bacterium]